MPTLKNETVLIKPLANPIHFNSDLCVVDAYTTKDDITEDYLGKVVPVKQGKWTAQSGFHLYSDYHKGYVTQMWAAIIAKTIADGCSKFSILKQINSVLEPILRNASAGTILSTCFKDVPELYKAINAQMDEWNLSEAERLQVLGKAVEILRETKGYTLYIIQRQMKKGSPSELAISDREMLAEVKTYADKCCQFEKNFVESIASKAIQFIQLKHESQAEFTDVKATYWEQYGYHATDSGRLGILDHHWLDAATDSAKVDKLQELSIDYQSIDPMRNPANFRKVESDSMGIGAVTRDRDSFNEIFVLRNDHCEIIEVLVSCDVLDEDE